MPKVLRSMRVSDEDWVAWREAASPLSVTAWLHELAADKIAHGQTGGGGKRAADASGLITHDASPATPTSSKPIACKHPKKTRGDSGLVRCDDCGKVNP